MPGAKGASAAGESEGFLVLDGLWFPPERGFLWQRADQAFAADIRARWAASGHPSARPVTAVLEDLEEVLREDPMGLRRLVLWRLACLLKDGDDGPGAATAQRLKVHAQRLGVHKAEAGPLAAAVAANFPAAGPARRAAEMIVAAVRGRRMREAAWLATDLPADSADDVLHGLLARLRGAIVKADGLMDEAVRHQRRGDVCTAGQAWLNAYRLVRDDQRAYTGLLGTAVLMADGPQPADAAAVRARTTADTVQLSWRPPESDEIAFQVVRFPERNPREAVEIGGTDAAPSATDLDVPKGVRLRYCVLPMRGDRIAGAPRATLAVILPPEVAQPSAVPVPDGARLDWRSHPEATGIRVTRSALDGGASPVSVPCTSTGLVDRPLQPARYRYTISCGYTGLDGQTEWSPGRQVTVEVKQWPAPVEDLTVGSVGEDGQVGIAWQRPATGQAFLVRWPFGAPRPGEDVSKLFNALSGEARQAYQPSGSQSWAELTAPTRTALRLVAVSVLGDLAVSGPSMVIENCGAVQELRVRRLGPDRAAVRFTWPEPAVLVLISWEQDDLIREIRIPRSRFLAEGTAVIPVAGERTEITVAPVPRPNAVHIAAGATTAVLDAVPVSVQGPLRASRTLTVPDADLETVPPDGSIADRGRRRRPWWRRLNPFSRERGF